MESGTVDLVEQQPERAAAALLEAIEIFHAGAANRWLVEICDFVAGIALSAGDGASAARLIGFADEARRVNGVARMRYYESIYLQILDQLEAALEAPEREQLVSQGRLLSNDDAFALARQVLMKHRGPMGPVTSLPVAG